MDKKLTMNNNIVQFVLLICILDLAKLCMHDDEVKSIASFKSACPVTVVSYAKGNPYVRKCFLKRRINYTVKSSATFNPAILMLTRSGINLVNPGPERRIIEQDNSNITTTPGSAHSIQLINSASSPSLEKPWITHMNCRSIISHIDELRVTFKHVSPQCIAITETWLNDSIFDFEVDIAGYTVHRLDRQNKRRGGGVAFYLSNGLKCTRRKDFEAIWIETRIQNIKYLFGCVYRAPDESLEIFDYMDDMLRYATQNNYEIMRIMILGDLNCDCLNASLKQTERLFEFLMVNGLEQLIKKPTRVTNNSQSLIDVLITSTPCLFKGVGVLTTASLALCTVKRLDLINIG